MTAAAGQDSVTRAVSSWCRYRDVSAHCVIKNTVTNERFSRTYILYTSDSSFEFSNADHMIEYVELLYLCSKYGFDKRSLLPL